MLFLKGQLNIKFLRLFFKENEKKKKYLASYYFFTQFTDRNKLYKFNTYQLMALVVCYLPQGPASREGGVD